MWRSVLVGGVLAGMLAGCSLGGGSDHSASGACGPMAQTAPHRSGVTVIPGFSGDMTRLSAVLRRRDLRIEVPGRWSETWFNGPSLGPSLPRGTRVPRGSIVKLVPTESALGSPGFANGSHMVPSVVGLTLSSAEARMEQSRVGWQVAAPSLSARVAPSELEDAYCVTGQTPSAGTVITYPKQSTVVRLRVDARLIDE
jgi:beta-lactam-binding protein with PASTA domain